MLSYYPSERKYESKLTARVIASCKSGGRRASPVCRYVRERSVIPRFYQVHLGSTDFGDADSDTRVLPFAAFCTELALP